MPETEVRRFDRSEVGKLVRREDGSLVAEAVITRAGIFRYRMPDGSLRSEFRSPEEVFSADSIETARMIPVTNGHPADTFVTPANAKKLAVGWTGENVRRDGNNVVAPLRVLDDEGVKAIDAGRRQLSCGYRCVVERSDGAFEGTPYTHAQRRIRYNHLALVDEGRAGEVASLRLDAADAVQEKPETSAAAAVPPPQEGIHMPGSRVKLDSGLDYEAPAEVAVAFEQLRAQRAELTAKLDAATKTLVETTAARDKAQGERDAVKAELEKVQKTDRTDEIRQAMRQRKTLEDAAAKVLAPEVVAKLDGMSDADIRLAVIVARAPEFKADGKSADYIAARFDAVVEALGTEQHSANGKGLAGDTSKPRADSADAVREKAIENAKRISRGLEPVK